MNSENVVSQSLEQMEFCRAEFENKKNVLQQNNRVWSVSNISIAVGLIALTMLTVYLKSITYETNLFVSLLNSTLSYLSLQFPYSLALCFFILEKFDPGKAFESIDNVQKNNMEVFLKSLNDAQKKSRKVLRGQMISLFLAFMGIILVSPLFIAFLEISAIGIQITLALICWGIMVPAISIIKKRFKLMKITRSYLKRHKEIRSKLQGERDFLSSVE